MFDTGSMNIISLDLAKQLRLHVSGQHTMQGFGGSVEAASAILNSISLGDLTMGQSEVTVIGSGPFSPHGLVGMLGREFLKQLVTRVDYEHGTLEFFDPASFAYAGRGARLPLTARGNDLMTTRIRVFGTDAEVQVDSGSEKSLVLFPKFVRKHTLHADVQAITGYGFGGLTRAMITRAPSLKMGDFEIQHPIVYLSTDSNGIEAGSADGNFGGELLREFTWIFDLPHSSLYVEPNFWYGKPELADRSGMVLDTRGGPARVLFVYPGSPAADAGIVEGDEPRDGSGKELTGEQWHDLLDASPGSVIRMLVKHNGRFKSISFALRTYM